MTSPCVMLLADCLNCGYSDVDEILSMVDKHGTDVIDNSTEYAEEMGELLCYQHFVKGVEQTVYLKLEGDISNEMRDRLATVRLTDNYLDWGRCSYIGQAEQDEREVFAEICRDGYTDELLMQLQELDGGVKND